jgi:hypothetical protein
VLSNSRKAHYFIDGRALCGKFMYLGSSYEDHTHESPDNCAACRRKREKLCAT